MVEQWFHKPLIWVQIPFSLLFFIQKNKTIFYIE